MSIVNKKSIYDRFFRMLFMSAIIMLLIIAAGSRAKAENVQVEIENSDTVADIKDKIDSAWAGVMTGENLTITGTKTGADSMLLINVPTGKNLKLTADYSGTVDGSEALIRVTNKDDINNGANNVEILGGQISNYGTGTTLDVYGAGSKLTISAGTISTDSGNGVHAGFKSVTTINGGTVSSVSGNGISISDVSASVVVLSGTVTTVSGKGIYNTNQEATITVSGGTVKATGNGNPIDAAGAVTINGNAVISSTTGDAVTATSASKTVTVAGGRITATTGRAIQSGRTISVTGGLIFSYGANLSSIISTYTTSGSGVVMAWSGSGGLKQYTMMDKTDITVNTGATAYWIKEGEKSGIYYSKSSGSGFVELDVTLEKATLTQSDLVYFDMPEGLIYTGSPQGIEGTVTGPSVFNSTTGGTITVYYTGKGNTSYSKNATAPTAAGSYSVSAEISGGTVFNAATGANAIALGEYTIDKATIAITDASIENKIYNGNTNAEVALVTFDNPAASGLIKDKDFSITGEFDSPDVLTAASVTVTVTLSNTPLAGNFIISGTYSAEKTISAASLSDAAVNISGNYTYSGSLIVPPAASLEVKLGLVTLVNGTDYTYAVTSGGINAGTATVTVTGKGNYTGIATGNFEIDEYTNPGQGKPSGDKPEESEIGESKVSTPAGGNPKQNEDGSYSLPLGGTIEWDGISVEVSGGTIISADGREITAGEDGAILTSGEKTMEIEQGETLVFDEDKPSGYYLRWDNPFKDVYEDNWFYEAVGYAYKMEVMKGDNGMFTPDMSLTRGMMAQVLWNLAGNPETENSTEFADVESDVWYSEAICWAADNGIVDGVGYNRFAPMESITREQMAVMLYRYCLYSGTDLPVIRTEGQFSDGDCVSDWAQEAVMAMYRAGILNGKPGGMFMPFGTATRGEVAQMLMNFTEVTK